MAVKKFKNKRATVKNNTDKLQNQVNNYKTRLENIGINPEEATDTRNALEKALNLEKDQNVLFDIFEILDRPRNALFTGINEAAEGGSFLEGLKEGILGETETSGKDLLTEQLGMYDEKGKLNMSDILGFGLDMFADPMDYILAPVKVANTAADVAKAVDAAKAAGKTADEIADITRAVEKGTHWALNTKEGWRPASEAVLRAAGGAIKGGAKITDKAVQKGLQLSDARNLAKVQDYAKVNNTSIDEAARALNISTNKLGTYNDIKKGVGRTLDSSKNLDGFTGRARDAEGALELNKTSGKIAVQKIDDKARQLAPTVAKRTGTSVEDAYNDIAKKLNTLIESNYDWTIRGDEILNELVQNKNIDLFTSENAQDLVEALSEYGIKANTDGRYVKLISNKSKLSNLTDDFSNKTFGKRLSIEDVNDINEARDFFNSSEELKTLYEEASKTLSGIASASDTVTGVAAKNITKEGYIPHVLTDDTKEFLKDTNKLKTGTNNQFNTRKYNMTANEANRLKNKQLVDTQTKVKTGLQKKTEVFEFDDKGNIKLDESGNYVRNQEWFDNQVERKKVSIQEKRSLEQSYEELRKITQQKIDEIDKSKLTSKHLTKLNTISADLDDLQKTITELKTLDLNKIPVENTDVVDDLNRTLKDYQKSQTKLMNALKNNANDDTIKMLRESSNTLKKQVTFEMNKVKKYTNTNSLDSLKTASKSFRQGKNVESEIRKLEAKRDDIIRLRQSLGEEAGTMSIKLKETIKYEEAALNKFITSEEKVWKKQVESLNKLYDADKILSSREGKEFLQTNFFDNISTYVNRNAEFSKGAQIYNEALHTGVLGNKEYVKFAEDLKDGKIPYNFEKVNGTYIKNKLSKFNGILPDKSKAAAEILNSFEGKNIYMDKELVKLLKIGNKALTNDVHPLLKAWDSMNNVFKRFSTLTAGFHLRNFSGNMSNMVLSGMPATKLPEYYRKAVSLWNKSDELMQKFVSNNLTDAEKIEWSVLEDFYKAGFADAFIKGQGLDDIVKNKKGLLNKVSSASMQLNNTLDSYNRLTLLMYAKENPKYLERLGKKDAIEAVRYALFDPTNMSDFEKNVMKRIMPFYTFTKQNLLFQADNIMKNTPKYMRLYKTIKDSYNDLPEDSYYQYQKESMQLPIPSEILGIPLPFIDDDGNQMFLKTNLPLSDLGEYMSNGLGRAVSSTSPLIRLPFEMTTGVDTFTGQETNDKYNTVSKFANKLGIEVDPTVQNMTQMAEQVLNSFGLQNVSTNIIKKVQAILENSSGEKSSNELWAEIFRSVLQNTKEENVRNSGLYDEMEQYQAIVKQLKNQGIDVPTIKEMTASNSLKLNNLKRKRASSR